MENCVHNQKNTNNPYDNYYTPIQLILPLDTSIIIDSSDPVYTFDEVLRSVDLKKYLVSSDNKDPRGRTGYNPVTLLKVILFGFQLRGYVSLRELADLCKNDIRFLWLLRFENKSPSHMTFSNFINTYLKDNIENIFNEINKYLFKKNNVDTSHVYIDGTKIEANANKYTWVWKKACITNRDKLFTRISEEIDSINDDISTQSVLFTREKTYEIPVLEDILLKIVNLFNIDTKKFVYGKGKRKTTGQRYYEFFDSAIKRLKSYAEKIKICGDERNSYSKTDKDATFMRIKTDYMGNDQLLPAYNVQFGICDGFVSVLDVNKFASDQSCFIPLMEKFNKLHGFYPQYPIADAGYGSLLNYEYCENHGMKKYMKFPMFEKETKCKTYHENPFRSVNFKINENGNPVCPNGKEFTFLRKARIKHLDRDRYEEFYQCSSCEECPLRAKCHKSSKNRIISLNRTLTSHHNEVIHNLESIHGALLLMNRSIQSEGVFGILKQDRFYRRIVRKGLKSVTLEITLIAIGLNIYKYHNLKSKIFK